MRVHKWKGEEWIILGSDEVDEVFTVRVQLG